MVIKQFFHLFFERAFRPFFLGALIFAVVAMAIFASLYTNNQARFSDLNVVQWHAHEMIFGYALATVAGFLLTAMVNWSKVPLASGWPLFMVFVAWTLARLGYLLDFSSVWIALFDLTFSWGLAVLFVWPALKQKLWPQMGLASKFVILALFNTLFYAQMHQAWLNLPPFLTVWLPLLSQLLWLSLFMVLAINVTMLHRVLLFFTEKTLGLKPFIDAPWLVWLNRLAMLGLISLMLLVVFWPQHPLTGVVAIITALLFLRRAIYGYHPHIWRHPLLWPLHLSYAFMTLGIGLFAGTHSLGWLGDWGWSNSLALHALSAGGIGLLCSAMLARISLGHTNRNIHQPPVWEINRKHGQTMVILSIQRAFILLALAGVFRVLMPWIWPSQTTLWITFAQWGWILGFGILGVLYAKILLSPSQRSSLDLY